MMQRKLFQFHKQVTSTIDDSRFIILNTNFTWGDGLPYLRETLRSRVKEHMKPSVLRLNIDNCATNTKYFQCYRSRIITVGVIR